MELLPNRCLIRTPSARRFRSVLTYWVRFAGTVPSWFTRLPRKRITSGLEKLVIPKCTSCGIQPPQLSGIPKYDVHRPFALIGGPVVVHRKAREDPLMDRVELTGYSIQQARPVHPQ